MRTNQSANRKPILLVSVPALVLPLIHCPITSYSPSIVDNNIPGRQQQANCIPGMAVYFFPPNSVIRPICRGLWLLTESRYADI